ncbi:3'-5' exonuclease [Methylobacterium sp. J-090]|uniref:3'-5' exonuclease n=1 Tax=Methylobacterium sp. J-090 TaxID=2836666 RepID=UPI001FBB7624|nr:3'-5' exonuclease [Methylobacterium sp. J-090]MCJ2082066.1 3'-5' exonuclease [Methylobacterium sp. J-090]
MDQIIDLNRCATVLDHSDHFRVLRRLEPRTVFDFDESETVRRGLILDVETTGLDHNLHQVIELGMVPFTYTDDGRILSADAPFCSFQEPFGPIPSEITRLTGIDMTMVSGCMIDRDAVKRLVEPVDLVIAHHANFDRKFAEDLLPIFAQKPWACSLDQVPWREEGMSGGKLSYLATDLGLFFEAHRAADDCQATLEILSRPLPRSGQTGFSHLLRQAFEPTWRVWAECAPFQRKDLLKSRTYRWSDGSNGRPRAWYRDFREEEVGLEFEFLRREVYGFPADIQVTQITALDRFSVRTLACPRSVAHVRS